MPGGRDTVSRAGRQGRGVRRRGSRSGLAAGEGRGLGHELHGGTERAVCV